jgi:UDP-perosamine 4-acetyltransferase
MGKGWHGMNDGIVVIGDSGHAKVCIELLQAMGNRVACCVGVTDGPDTCVGVPVFKGDAHLAKLRTQGYSKVFVAVGANCVRQRLADTARELGYSLVNAISPQAVVSPSARLGNGIAVMAGAVVNAETVIEDLAIINTGACIDHDCRIGKAVHIAPQCGLAGNVSVGAGSFLGIGCKVIPEISIGENVSVGAGGVVVCDIASETRVVGVPAKPINIKER